MTFLNIRDIRTVSQEPSFLAQTKKIVDEGSDRIFPGGGGGTLIFSYIRRLGPFFGGQIFEFQYFLGFSEK